MMRAEFDANLFLQDVQDKTRRASMIALEGTAKEFVADVKHSIEVQGLVENRSSSLLTLSNGVEYSVAMCERGDNANHARVTVMVQALSAEGFDYAPILEFGTRYGSHDGLYMYPLFRSGLTKSTRTRFRRYNPTQLLTPLGKWALQKGLLDRTAKGNYRWNGPQASPERSGRRKRAVYIVHMHPYLRPVRSDWSRHGKWKRSFQRNFFAVAKDLHLSQKTRHVGAFESEIRGYRND